jgi:hypothetical protein
VVKNISKARWNYGLQIMEESEDPNNKRFLKYLGGPYKSAFQVLTLRSGVILLTIIDLVIAIFGTFYLFSNLHAFVPHKRFHFNEKIRLGLCILNVLNVPFALIGLKGILNLDKRLVLFYYKFEICELYLEALLDIFSLEVTVLRHGHFRMRLFLYKLVIFLFFNIISFIATKVTWSAYVFIESGYLDLVLYGEDAVKLIKTQEVYLAGPRHISAGMEIKVGSIEEEEI